VKDGQKCKEEEETTLGANGILGETTRYLSLSESAVVSADEINFIICGFIFEYSFQIPLI
jgi:hypothetical protein